MKKCTTLPKNQDTLEKLAKLFKEKVSGRNANPVFRPGFCTLCDCELEVTYDVLSTDGTGHKEAKRGDLRHRKCENDEYDNTYIVSPRVLCNVVSDSWYAQSDGKSSRLISPVDYADQKEKELIKSAIHGGRSKNREAQSIETLGFEF